MRTTPSAQLRDDLLATRTSLAQQTRVERCTEPLDWIVMDGVLRHRSEDYFELAAYTDANGAESLLIRQSETALVGLIVAGVGEERMFLLNARCEPGLRGLCQFSTTVQSTPSNYERRHGGESTPFIDLFLRDRSNVRVLHDSLEFDWGQYYDSKRKRFLVVEAQEAMPVSVPLAWVPEALVRDLLNENYLTTSDLRATMALLDAYKRAEPGEMLTEHDAVLELAPTQLDSLTNWRRDSWGFREIEPVQHVTVEYVHIESTSREVASWSQPLVKPREAELVRLWTRGRGESRVFAVEKRSQRGLRGRTLFYPAASTGARGRVSRQTRTSAEGGRFLDHDVVLELAELDDASALGEAQWVSEYELAHLMLTPQCTSVELRLVASLLDNREA